MARGRFYFGYITQRAPSQALAILSASTRRCAFAVFVLAAVASFSQPVAALTLHLDAGFGRDPITLFVVVSDGFTGSGINARFGRMLGTGGAATIEVQPFGILNPSVEFASFDINLGLLDPINSTLGTAAIPISVTIDEARTASDVLQQHGSQHRDHARGNVGIKVAGSDKDQCRARTHNLPPSRNKNRDTRMQAYGARTLRGGDALQVEVAPIWAWLTQPAYPKVELRTGQAYRSCENRCALRPVPGGSAHANGIDSLTGGLGLLLLIVRRTRALGLPTGEWGWEQRSAWLEADRGAARRDPEP